MASKGLKFWLYDRIGDERYPGLIWEDADELKFRVPWVGQSEPGWEKYYKLFYHWSQRDLELPFDSLPDESVKAKGNFRSALNSKHFTKISKEDRQTGSYVIYQFVDTSHEEMAARSWRTATNNISKDFQQNDAPVLSHVNGASQQPVGNGFLTAVDNDPNITIHRTYREQFQMPMHAATGEWVSNANPVPNYAGHANNEPGPYGDVCDDIVMSSIPSLNNEEIMCKLFAMEISREDLSSCEYSMEYMGRIQRMDHVLNMEKNSKFIYGSLDNANAVESVNKLKNSPYYSEQLYELAEPLDIGSESLMKILKNMNTGISIWFDITDLCIKVVRHCRTHVFSFDVIGSNESPTLLTRDQPYPVFSYKQFLLDRTNGSVAPDSKIELVAGVRPTEKGAVAKGVKIILKPCGALKLLNCDDMLSLRDICLSIDPSSLDRELGALTISGFVANA